MADESVPDGLAVIERDIMRQRVGAIVNAASSTLLGGCG
jgi:O-acetyl-ADP-ribose deacetylase (regulator of RNase III)